jgi:hypothetical protein
MNAKGKRPRKRAPSLPGRPRLVAAAIRKLAGDVAYRAPYRPPINTTADALSEAQRAGRPLKYAVLERPLAEALLRVLRAFPLANTVLAPAAEASAHPSPRLWGRLPRDARGSPPWQRCQGREKPEGN